MSSRVPKGQRADGFHVIVLTAANPSQAEVYLLELQKRKEWGLIPNTTMILTVPDPGGQRVGRYTTDGTMTARSAAMATSGFLLAIGLARMHVVCFAFIVVALHLLSFHCVSPCWLHCSGGATLNALHAVAKAWSASPAHNAASFDLSKHRVLILHSGGDSQRIPIFSVRGKAFSSLPSVTADGSFVYAPIDFLMKQMSTFCAGAPPGGVCIAATDVLLILPAEYAWKDNAQGVTGLAMATHYTVGLHHGLYVADSDPDMDLVQGKLKYVLQKPSKELMTEKGAIRKVTKGQT